MQLIFNNLAADELDSELLDTMQEAMLLRLEDKVPAVRAQAVQALPRLCDPGEVSCRFCQLTDSGMHNLWLLCSAWPC